MIFRGNLAGAVHGDQYAHRFGESSPEAEHGCFSLHAHDHLELVFITKGQYRMGTTDFEDVFCEGDVFIANEWEAHWGKCPVRPHTENAYRYLQLDPKQLPRGLDPQLDQLIGKEFSLANKITAQEARESGFFEVGIRLLNACDDADGNNNLEKLGYTVLLLQLLCRHRRREGVRRERSAFAKEVLQYIEQHYAEDLSMESVARHFGYEKSYFCRKFRQNFNQSFTDHLNHTRIKKFDSHPALNLQTIAYCAREVGFSNYSYFYQVYKRINGLSPREYMIRKATHHLDIM